MLLQQLMVHKFMVRRDGHQLPVRPLADPAVARRAELVRPLDLRATAHGAVQAVFWVHLEPHLKLVAPLRLQTKVLGLQAMAAEPGWQGKGCRDRLQPTCFFFCASLYLSAL